MTTSSTISITTTIPGARTLDQLGEPTLDSAPDEDARENCVAASIAEGLNILIAGGAQKYVGDELHDSVYGQGYIGPQAAWRYVNYCNDRGVWLHAVGGSQAALVATIHKQVSAGHPVVVTMPSNWATAPADPVHPAGSTHVGLAVGIGSDAIRVMNPWHGFMQDASDTWWQARLCEGEVWVMERTNAAMGFTGATGQPAPFYGLVYTSDMSVWSCPATKRTLGHGFLGYYQALKGQNGVCATQILGLPTSDEYKTADGKTRQDFERGALIYDAHGSGAWQIYNAPVGNELAELKLQIVALQAEVAKLQTQDGAAQTVPAPSPAPSGSAVTAEEIAQAASTAFSAAFMTALEKAAS
ncbi:MAG TPA: hypothetical protein VFU63_02370 [Ktedonobacterales bacterium]|nr:hypothetical protein [Ktedonobacterales bacterium]